MDKREIKEKKAKLKVQNKQVDYISKEIIKSSTNTLYGIQLKNIIKKVRKKYKVNNYFEGAFANNDFLLRQLKNLNDEFAKSMLNGKNVSGTKLDRICDNIEKVLKIRNNYSDSIGKMAEAKQVNETFKSIIGELTNELETLKVEYQLKKAQLEQNPQNANLKMELQQLLSNASIAKNEIERLENVWNQEQAKQILDRKVAVNDEVDSLKVKNIEEVLTDIKINEMREMNQKLEDEAIQSQLSETNIFATEDEAFGIKKESKDESIDIAEVFGLSGKSKEEKPKDKEKIKNDL